MRFANDVSKRTENRMVITSQARSHHEISTHVLIFFFSCVLHSSSSTTFYEELDVSLPKFRRNPINSLRHFSFLIEYISMIGMLHYVHFSNFETACPLTHATKILYTVNSL